MRKSFERHAARLHRLFPGIWEQIVGGASTRYYTFNGQAIAVRDSATNAVTYLHGDHLGSVSLATNSSGAVVRAASLHAASLLCRDFFQILTNDNIELGVWAGTITVSIASRSNSWSGGERQGCGIRDWAWPP